MMAMGVALGALGNSMRDNESAFIKMMFIIGGIILIAGGMWINLVEGP
jgi:sulfite exporter TauE/SafE